LAPFPGAGTRLLRPIIRGWLAFLTRKWLPWLGVYRLVEIQATDRLRSAGPLILVANHRSFIDGLMLLGLAPDTGVLLKARDARQPTYALAARSFDVIGVDRNSRASIASALERSRALLAAGKRLLVFAEGSRAPSGRLQHFQRIAFQLALAANAPILPVILHSTCPLMAKVPGSLFPRGRNEYRIRFLDLERPRPDDDADSLCDRVHRRMARELKLLDAGTCWEVRDRNPRPVLAP